VIHIDRNFRLIKLSNFDCGTTSRICPPRGALSQICPPRGDLFKPFNMSPSAKIQKNDVCLRGSTNQSGTRVYKAKNSVYYFAATLSSGFATVKTRSLPIEGTVRSLV
jgi:hypothetical protein